MKTILNKTMPKNKATELLNGLVFDLSQDNIGLLDSPYQLNDSQNIKDLRLK